MKSNSVKFCVFLCLPKYQAALQVTKIPDVHMAIYFIYWMYLDLSCSSFIFLYMYIYLYVISLATSWHNMLWEKQMIPQKIKTTVLVYSSAQTGLKIVFNEPIILVIIHRCMYYSNLYILWNHLKCHEIPIFSYAFVICKFMDS